jgi:hypothetical protein
MTTIAVAGGLIAAAVPAAAATEAAPYCATDVQTHKSACGDSEAQAAQLAGVAKASVLAVTLYDGINYSGASYSFYVTKDCTAGYEGEYGNPNLGAFSNKASSVHTYHHCDVHLHDPINYGTPYSVWIDQSANLANIGNGWNDRASSIGVS